MYVAMVQTSSVYTVAYMYIFTFLSIKQNIIQYNTITFISGKAHMR